MQRYTPLLGGGQNYKLHLPMLSNTALRGSEALWNCVLSIETPELMLAAVRCFSDI